MATWQRRQTGLVVQQKVLKVCTGALLFAVYLGAAEVTEAFGINKSFLVLFMVIIGGLGSIFGSFAGAAFLVCLPELQGDTKLTGQGIDVSYLVWFAGH